VVRAICLSFVVFDAIYLPLYSFSLVAFHPIGVAQFGLWMLGFIALICLAGTPRNLAFTEDGMGVGPIFMRRPVQMTPWTRKGKIVQTSHSFLFAFFSGGVFLILGKVPDQVGEEWPT
jgi:hypothetical protein